MPKVKTLARGLKILEILADSHEGVGITALAEQMEMDKASVSRMVQTLAKYGYVEKAPDGRRYQLGVMIVNLSRSVIDRMPLRDVAKPYLHEMVERTGECAHLAIFAHGQVLYIDQVESPAALRVNADVGHVAPLYCTALGKVLLAFGDYDIPESLDSLTEHTITSVVQLERDLEETRSRGYALDDEEYDYGVRCIAVPVHDLGGKIIAAMGISGPSHRMSLEQIPELVAHVVEVGQTLSDRLSFKRH
ncbi:MAG: IclR family transcriptional regulator [Chloroflexi bacterium]|nr:IclR family transcriptional regulator [Chloroflexota bacterium]